MKNLINLYLQEVLDKKRLTLLPKLKFFKEKGFYLAGGTALALQFGHRESIDFDFFIAKNIDTEKLYDSILENFSGEKVKKTFEENNTLYIEINGVKISFMTYNYDLLRPLLDTEYLNIANIEDIGCMKLWAIQNRATNKDYVDLYYILHEISLKKLISSFYIKFGNIINENLINKSIVYFDDIENEDLIMINELKFKDVKKYLIEIVKKY